ncbi:MAG: hypothetical protein B6244_01110 [Candidatus Cloacimonetes bacterium 4572_55]|nr:MAG: hypothetical protein B6244_01110 [Candidatus Cloacimonetes bacterium 4572_55]
MGIKLFLLCVCPAQNGSEKGFPLIWTLPRIQKGKNQPPRLEILIDSNVKSLLAKFVNKRNQRIWCILNIRHVIRS